ncbi:MAG: peptidylprolyl isomerase [Myxococcota bacterium]
MPNPTAILETSLGTFEAEIYVEQMPITGGNFVALARAGFYDGQHFHRVVPDFMIQTGCPYTRDPRDPRAGSGGPPHGTIPDELTARISNRRGTLSMANMGRPDTGGSQFFVNLADNDFLDWFAPGPSAHPVFGRVTRGIEIADAIGRVTTDEGSRPVEPVELRRVLLVGA